MTAGHTLRLVMAKSGAAARRDMRPAMTEPQRPAAHGRQGALKDARFSPPRLCSLRILPPLFSGVKTFSREFLTRHAAAPGAGSRDAAARHWPRCASHPGLFIPLFWRIKAIAALWSGILFFTIKGRLRLRQRRAPALPFLRPGRRLHQYIYIRIFY